MLAYFLIPHVIISILLGAQYQKAGDWLGFYGVAYLAYAVANVLMYYAAAIGRFQLWSFVVVSTIIEVSILATLHRSIAQLTYGMDLSFVCILVLAIGYTVFGRLNS